MKAISLNDIYQILIELISELSDISKEVWTWFITADILVLAQIIGIIVIGLVVLILLYSFLRFTLDLYNRMLLIFYEKHPKVMKVIFLSFVSIFFISFILIFIGLYAYEPLFALGGFAFPALLLLIIFRKPKKNKEGEWE